MHETAFTSVVHDAIQRAGAHHVNRCAPIAAKLNQVSSYWAAAGSPPLAVFFCDFFAGAFFAALLEADFFATASTVVAATAFFAAQRFFNAATIAAFPAALSVRFGFEGSGEAGAAEDSAHRLRWASLMRFRAAALIGRRFALGASGVTTGPPGNMARSSAI
jgi:hypothetical protein